MPLLIVALGTSFTSRGDWSPLVTALTARHQGPVRFVNAGKGGANSRYGVKMATSLAEMRPDLVSIEFAVNDADIRSAMRIAESVRNMGIIIEEFRSRNPRVRLYMILTHRLQGSKRWLRLFLETYYEAHARLAKSMDVTVIDIRLASHWLSASARRNLLPDGVHFTEKGFAVAAAPSIVAAMTLASPCE